ncbi:MAG TPA: calcium-binding protein [Conexibacter sp.]|nr:calcium-binding protein [Conexibacter sp.]
MRTRSTSLKVSLRTLAAAGVLSAVLAPSAMAHHHAPSSTPPTGYSESHGHPKCFGMTPTIVIAHKNLVTVGTDGDDVILGTDGKDTIFGHKGNDRICGRGGADKIVGNVGDDQLDGGAGRDVVAGWAGNDLVEGGNGRDVLRGNSGDDVVYAGGGDDDDINLGPGSDYGFGDNGSDRMSGWGDGPAQVDHCFGGGGFDRARNCDAPVDPLTGVFDPWAGNGFEIVNPGTPH